MLLWCNIPFEKIFNMVKVVITVKQADNSKI